MTRKIKGLGLAFVAIAALSMVVAGGAQATVFHANTPNSASIFAHQHVANVFTTNAGAVQCTQATFEGTAQQAGSQQVTADELQVRPTYTGCQAFGQAATIDTNGCQFTLTTTSQTGQTFATTANVDVVGCTSGQVINITTGICRMTVPQQNNISHMVFAQTGNDVTAQITAAGITYQADGPLCPTMATGQTLANGQYTGALTVLAKEDKGGTPVLKHGHEYQELLQTGAQVALQVT